MQTRYASGRASLPAPTVTLNGTGDIAGGNTNYYFWIKGRNRVGYNEPSTVTTLSIPNNSQISLSAANFVQYSWEDWREFSIFTSKTNTFSTSRCIYKQPIYEDDQISEISLSSVAISADYVLNGSGIIATPDLLPTGMPNGFRVLLSSTNKVYEFIVDSNEVVDGITVIAGSGGQWLLVASNSLTETSTAHNKQLYEVLESEFRPAPVESSFDSAVGLKYYLYNNDAAPLESGELDLNAFVSDSTLRVEYDVEIIGYLNLSSYALDTADIQYAGSIITYPETKLQLTKPLPDGSALVIALTPQIQVTGNVVKGTYITTYPKLNDYTLVDEVAYFSDPVLDLDTLRALPPSIYRDRQARFVYTKQNFYVFDAASALEDDGDTVIAPNTEPATGRWRILQQSLQDGSVTADKLAEDVVALINAEVRTTTVNLPISTSYVVNLDSQEFDYFIIKTPLDDGGTTTINVTATQANNTTKAAVIELRQKTGEVEFDASLLFPGGAVPTFSGNNKNDLFLIILTKDDAGVTKKRIYLTQKDIG